MLIHYPSGTLLFIEVKPRASFRVSVKKRDRNIYNQVKKHIQISIRLRSYYVSVSTVTITKPERILWRGCNAKIYHWKRAIVKRIFTKSMLYLI